MHVFVRVLLDAVEQIRVGGQRPVFLGNQGFQLVHHQPQLGHAAEDAAAGVVRLVQGGGALRRAEQRVLQIYSNA